MERMDELYKLLPQEQQHELVFNLNRKKTKWFPCGEGEFLGVHCDSNEQITVTRKLHGWCNGTINKGY